MSHDFTNMRVSITLHSLELITNRKAQPKDFGVIVCMK